ncbi:tape measure protein [Shewanella psychrotolerans]|uniref:tape measure protein n=1 Tax=Shewanella psychrotolerans TaxID=2864206 RepID=UPI001C65F5BE|nr:tape measure protein [Shewanella psychrotolerans]QYK02800.1 tape measure protein [Shewanella psychrotolerans]
MADKTLELALRIVAEATGKQHIEALVDELKRIGQESDVANPKAAALATELDGLANQQELINSFKQSRNELEQQELALTAAALGLQDLKQRASETDQPFVQLARSIDTAEKELEQMQAELAKQSASHTKLQNALSKSGIDYNNLTTAQRKLGAELDGAGRKVDKFAGQLERGDTKARDNAASLRGVVGQVTALAGAYVGLDRVAQAIKDVFATGDQFERLGVQMNAVMGSFESGKQATDWVKTFARDVPLQLNEVNQAFVKAKAFGLDPMNGTMKAIVDQAFKLGGGFQEVEGITLALGQAWAKQKLQGEEILQLIERGVPVWDMLAKVTGKNSQELQKLSEQGKLGRDVMKALIDEMGRASEGSAAAQMALLSGQVSNLKDNLTSFYNDIAQSGALDWLKGQISDLNAEFAAMAADGRLKQWAQQVSDTIVTIGSAVQDGAALLYHFRDEIGFVAKAWLALKVGSYFSDVVTGANAAIGAMRLYTGAITGTAAASESATLAAGKLKAALAAAARAGLYLALISELVELARVYRDLLIAEEALARSQREAASSAKQLEYSLRDLSEQTGVAFSNMAEFNQAVDDGKLIYDDAAGKWINAAKAMEQVKQAAIEVVEPIKLTVDEALKLTLTLSEQTKTLDGIKGGMGGFIRQIDAAIAPLQAAGSEYAAHVKLLTELRGKFEQQQVYLDATAQGAGALQQAYKELGLTSSEALQQTSDKAEAAFNLIKNSREPIEQQKDAFNAWAKAALEAAEATGQTVPETLKSEAATLGLSQTLDNLVAKQYGYRDSVKSLSPEQAKLSKELQQTENRLKQCRDVMNSSTASSKDKAKAQKELAQLQGQLSEQTKQLTEVQALESANYIQLKAKYEAVSKELLRLDDAYKNGALTAEEYLKQKERIIEVLRILQRLMGGLEDGEQDLDEQAGKTTKTLAEQKEELEALEKATGRATEYVNLYAGAFQHLNKQFDFSADSTEKLKARQDELRTMIMQNMSVFSGFWQLLAETSNQAFIRENRIISETLAIRNWTSELESSSITLERVNEISRYATRQIRELGDEELKPLQAAIDATRNRILDLRDDINGTVNSLKDELDQLNNNQTAIEKRRYEQQQAELQSQLDAAKTAQDKAAISSAQEALRLSKEIYQTKLKQIDAEASERRQREQAQPSQSSRDTSTSRSPTQTVSTRNTITTVSTGRIDTVRLELVMPSGQVVKADLLDEFKQLLFSELEQIKATS